IFNGLNTWLLGAVNKFSKNNRSIVIPKWFKFQLTKLLMQMNITAETLYPGLSGMAKSLSYLRHGMHEYEE
ncbi:hypothetical protein, partial [Duncaniella freteri]|uniref:hypothetical protein n=1 Tax=Duncaniella freteri TaxID=2530391 RepID=UPI0032B1BA5A